MLNLIGGGRGGRRGSGRVPVQSIQRWDTVYDVSVLTFLGYFVGIPVVLVLLLAARIWSQKGPRAAVYQMADSWTHPPILWAATDEAVGSGHGHGKADFTVGGGASGNW